MSDPIFYLLSRLDKVRERKTNTWEACCPAHDDRNPSLSITLVDDGRVLVKCFACCDDVNRVHFIHGVNDFDGRRSIDPAHDIQLLRDKIRAMRVPIKRIIIDPIVSAVASDSDKNAEVRRDLQGIVDLAQHRHCAVIGISHFSKVTAGQDPIDRVTGSLAFGALSRVVFAAAKLEEKGVGRRIFTRAKSYIGPDSGGFHYKLKQVELDDHPGVITSQLLWGDAVDGTARDLLKITEGPAVR